MKYKIIFRKKYAKKPTKTEDYSGSESEMCEYIRGWLNATLGRGLRISYKEIIEAQK